jgi:hypothetical protein
VNLARETRERVLGVAVNKTHDISEPLTEYRDFLTNKDVIFHEYIQGSCHLANHNEAYGECSGEIDFEHVGLTF